MHFLFSSLLLFYYVSAPVVDMREHPHKDAEIVSQAYYSEEVNLLADDQGWQQIETTVDHYKGWIQKGALVQRETYPAAVTVKVNRNRAHVYPVEDTIYGPTITLPFDSKLDLIAPLEPSNSRWLKIQLVDGQQAYIQRGDVTFENRLLDLHQMLDLSYQFLDLPYTWGGRSSFGYDCSGFVQMLFRQMGIALPRDSKDQINWEGFSEVSLDHLLPGDIIFFGLAAHKIGHVGLYLGEDHFIHAGVAENRPYIRVACLSNPDWNGSGRFAYRAARRLKGI